MVNFAIELLLVHQDDLLDRRNRPVVGELDLAVLALCRRRKDLDNDQGFGCQLLARFVRLTGDGKIGDVARVIIIDNRDRSLGPRAAIRDLDYKLVSNDSKTYYLFDLKNDRSETKNLIDSKPMITNRLLEKLENWKNSLPPNNSGWNPTIGPKRTDFGSPQPYHRLPSVSQL